MKTCGFQFLTIAIASLLGLPAFGWNLFGNNDDSSYSGYESNASGTIYVKSQAANFRSAPFLDGSSVFGTFRQNTALRVIRKDSYSDSGTWYFVSDGHGHTGWINSHVVSGHPVSQAQPSSARVAQRSETTAPTPRARPAQRVAQNSTAPVPSAEPASAAPAAAAPAPQTPAAPATTAWGTPVPKQDTSAFPPAPDFNVAKKDTAAPASAAPATAAADPAKPAASTPPPPAKAVTQAPQQKVTATTSQAKPKPAPKKDDSPLSIQCTDEFPSRTFKGQESQLKTWEDQNRILRKVMETVGSTDRALLGTTFQNKQVGSTPPIKLSVAKNPTDPRDNKIFLNIFLNNSPQPVSFPAQLCFRDGVVSAEGPQGKLVLNRLPGEKGFSTDLSNFGFGVQEFTRVSTAR